MKRFTQWLLLAAIALTALPAMADTFRGGRTDFRDETIYFAMTSRFYDGDPSNNVYCWDGKLNDGDPEWRGDFKGLIEKMDYIKALGFTAIWITPVVENASGLDYHGYHAFDFRKVDPRLESEDVSFKKVIEEAHSRDMKIVLDIVLQHTGNFGEAYLCPMFTKDYTSASNHKKTMRIIPNGSLPDNYWSLPGGQQHDNRLNNMKNTKGNGGDPHNYWHHVGQQWDWDDYRRVWGQIAGDCVDLNTENPHVYNYLIDCYTTFINMGVDAFRIDTTGHIARVTFNKVFIPRLHAAAEAAKDARDGAPFFMFGECCAVSEEAIYRGANWNCSPCFYTWAETKDYAWDDDETSWDGLSYTDCDPTAYNNHPNGLAVNSQTKDYEGHSSDFVERSDNHKLDGNTYHKPDYSKSSNFNVIDFPMHQRFHNAKNAFTVRNDDYLYNDATWNVCYVDSHDYGPNGYKVMSFNPGDDTWAENLSLMFSFRGIPCIFQGTECGFRRQPGTQTWIDQGGNQPLAKTLRAYYGGYLTGSVTAKDFAEYTDATGNLAATLSQPLAQHLQRLNQIRAAVPALRKGQYSTEGCSGTMAFKRRFTDDATGIDSYCLVTISGDATFTGVLNGRYVDAITGDVKDVDNGTLEAKCSGKANMCVYVLNGPGKIGVDGKYLHGANVPEITTLAYDGNQEAQDLVTVRDTEEYDPSATPKVVFSPNGGSFRTATVEVTASLANDAVSGWYEINGNRTNVTTATKFTLGSDMDFGETITVKWGAKGGDNIEYTGNVSYKKVDPDNAITIYVTGKNDANIDGVYLHAWTSAGDLNGGWPGKKMTEKTTIGGREFYYQSFDVESLNVIFNMGGDSHKTGDIKGITEDTYFEYDGNNTANKIEVNPDELSVKISPKGGEFNGTREITLTVANATSAWYKIGNGSQIAVGNGATKFTIGQDMAIGETVTVSWSATDGVTTIADSATFKKVEKPVVVSSTYEIYFDNSNNWSKVYAYCWDDNKQEGNSFSGAWPGKQLTETVEISGKQMYRFTFNYDKDLANPMIIIHDGGNNRAGSGNMNFVNHAIYNANGKTNQEFDSVEVVEINESEAPVEYYNLQGIRVDNPAPGKPYIRRQGSRVSKVIFR